MLRRAFLSSLVLCGFVFSVVTSAQSNDPAARAQDIIQQARAAIGDESKIAALKSLTAAGNSRRVFGEREIQTQVELELLMPDKVRRTTTTSPFPGTEFQQVEVVTADGVWFDSVSTSPMGGGGGGPIFTERVGGGGGGGGGDVVRQGGGAPGGGAARQGGGPNRVMMGPGGAGMSEEQRQILTKTDMTRLLIGMLLVPAPTVQLEYTWIGEAKAPDGVADVIQVKGPGDAKTMLFIDRTTHRVLMLSYKGKDMRNIRFGQPGGRGPGGPGGAGGQQAGGQQPAGQQPAGQQAPGQQAGGPPQMTPEEREKRMKELQEQIAKAPDVDFFYRFGDYKPVNGLNLPHLITRATADQTTEEWVLKYKINPNIKPDRFVKKQK